MSFIGNLSIWISGSINIIHTRHITPPSNIQKKLGEYFYPFPIQNIGITYACFWLGRSTLYDKDSVF